MLPKTTKWGNRRTLRADSKKICWKSWIRIFGELNWGRGNVCFRKSSDPICNIRKVAKRNQWRLKRNVYLSQYIATRFRQCTATRQAQKLPVKITIIWFRIATTTTSTTDTRQRKESWRNSPTEDVGEKESNLLRTPVRRFGGRIWWFARAANGNVQMWARKTAKDNGETGEWRRKSKK